MSFSSSYFRILQIETFEVELLENIVDVYKIKEGTCTVLITQNDYYKNN